MREARAAADAGELSLEDRAIVREVWRDVSREEKLPVEFVKELTQVTSEAYHVWMDARRKKDFKLFAPHLTKIVALKRREAELVGFAQSPYDALLDTFEPYATTQEIAVALGDLKNFLAPFLVKIRNSKAKVSREAIAGDFDIEKQKAFSALAAKGVGYDFDAGRLDVSAHPFSTSFHPLDSRITTRYNRSEFMQSISGVIHETGHALYEQGLPAARFGTPLGEAVSLGIHESQSRLWGKSGWKKQGVLDLFLPAAAGRNFLSRCVAFRWRISTAPSIPSSLPSFASRPTKSPTTFTSSCDLRLRERCWKATSASRTSRASGIRR